jgi:hypothetical protein
MEAEILKIINELEQRVKKLEESDIQTNDIFKTLLSLVTKLEGRLSNIEKVVNQK